MKKNKHLPKRAVPHSSRRLPALVLCLLFLSGMMALCQNSSPKVSWKDFQAIRQMEAGQPSTKSEEQNIERLIAQMTLDEKIYQMFFVTPEQLLDSVEPVVSSEVMSEILHEKPIGGIIFFQENILSPQQCISMTEGLQKASSIRLFIGVDEEGGRVARIANNPKMNTTAFPPMSDIGKISSKNAEKVGETIGHDISQFGFNLDFAPVADIRSNPDNTVIGDRAFSDSPQTTAKMVAATVQGFHKSKVMSCLKHFPGHGDTQQDSHTQAALTERTRDEMREAEFLPFAAGIQAGAEFVMAGHICTPNITGNQEPASLSKTLLTDCLRKELNFSGIIITDSMSMKAITGYYNADTAAVKALEAGADMILIPANLDAAVNGLRNAVSIGTLSEKRLDESLMRILKVKDAYGLLEHSP